MVGKTTTAADKTINADRARQLFGLSGKGIKVGIISDSFNTRSGLREDVKSGDLPGKNNPNSFNTPVNILSDSSETLLDEGRALGQVIHDIAPEAELFFHTFATADEEGSFVNEDSFANSVSALVAAGVDVIVEDTVLAAPLLQDGKAVQAIEAAVAQGVTVVSAAGNDGGIAYESVFRPGNEFEFSGLQFQAHDFDSTQGVDLFQNINLPTENTFISTLLGWDKPIGEPGSEYVKFLVNTPELPNADNIVAASLPINDPAENIPLEGLEYAPQQGEQLYFVIAKVGSDAPERQTTLKWVSSANGADRNIDYEYIDESANNRTVYGQQNAPSSIVVGATDIENPTEIRSYSSRGGVPILIDSDGERLPNPVLRSKPDIYAPDGIQTSFPEDSPLSNFFGTSASAPHIAGTIALMLERAGKKLLPQRVRSILKKTALPVSAEAGLAQADLAVQDSFSSTQSGSKSSDRIKGTALADNLYGRGGNDVILGKGGKDYLRGGKGNDLIAGGLDNDVIYGGQGDDVLRGDRNRRDSGSPLDGDDTIFGGAGNDRIGGKGGDDWLVGGRGDDHIWGDDGDDILNGGSGHNILTGGMGQDTFVLAQNKGTQQIVDFALDADFFGLADGLKFDDLLIEQGVGSDIKDTFISLGSDLLAVVTELDASTLGNQGDTRFISFPT